MLHALAVAVVLVGASAGAANADPDADAQAALREADQRAAAHDPGALAAYEAVGAARPVTRWSDVAWAHAARMAEQVGDFARARRDLEQAIAIGGDGRLVARARADLARLVAATGGGRWDSVATEHGRLADQLLTGDDPKPALAQLEALIAANPGYPRTVSAALEVADGWERDGNAERAISWLEARRAGASAADASELTVALIRALIRHGDVSRAEAELSGYAQRPAADRIVADELAALLVQARHHAWLRMALWALVVALAAAAIVQLLRDPRGWRVALRRLIRPPIDALFLLPIGVVLIIVAATGNPMVARAVRQIVVAGWAIAWLSGAVLEARRAARGSIGAPRALAHAVAALCAVGAIAYLALDHDHLLGMVAETVREGPAMR